MLGLNVTVREDDIVDVAGRLFVKTPGALRRLLKELRKEGYDVINLYRTKYYGEGQKRKDVEKYPFAALWRFRKETDYICIHEAWHWAPLPVSSKLCFIIASVAGARDDNGDWHDNIGRYSFYDDTWQGVAKFIRHFTLVNADAFDAAWPSFRYEPWFAFEDLEVFFLAQMK